MFEDRCFDPTTDHAALVSGIGSSCHTTSGSSQNFDPITVHATTSFGPNFDPSTSHALGFGRRSSRRFDPIIDHAALGSDCHATFDFGQNSDPITINAVAGSGPNFDPSKGHALGSDRHSDPTTNHAALGFGKGSGCHATSSSSQNSNPITVHAATSSGPNSNPSTGHALGSGRRFDPTTDYVALGFNTSFGFQATLGFSQNSDPITVHATAGSGPNSDPSTSHALGSGTHSDPTTG